MPKRSRYIRETQESKALKTLRIQAGLIDQTLYSCQKDGAQKRYMFLILSSQSEIEDGIGLALQRLILLTSIP